MDSDGLEHPEAGTSSEVVQKEVTIIIDDIESDSDFEPIKRSRLTSPQFNEVLKQAKVCDYLYLVIKVTFMHTAI